MAENNNPFNFESSSDSLLSTFNPHGGLRLPNFNANNNFGNPNAQSQTVGSPFQMTGGALMASSQFQNTSFGGLSSSLNNVASTLNTAANKLSSAADKLIAAVSALSNRAAPGGQPVMPAGGQPGQPFGSVGRGGFGPSVGLGLIGSAANFASNQYFAYTGADIQYNNTIAAFEQGQMGLGTTYRNAEAQRQAQRLGQRRGLGYGALGALAVGGAIGIATGGLGFLAMGGAVAGAGLGFGIGQQSGEEEAYSKALLLDQATINRKNAAEYKAYRQEFEQAKYEQKAMQAGLTTVSDTLRTKAQFSRVDEREPLIEAARASDLYNNVSSQYANLERQSLALSGLRGGGLSMNLMKGDPFVAYRNNLGIGTGEAMALEASIIGSSGRRGLGGLNASTITGAIQSGYGAGEIGLSASFLRQGGGLRGLGFGATTLLGQANALGLVGGGATEYMQAAGGFFGGFAQRGVSGFNEQGVKDYSGFINAGRKMGMRGFEGALGFKRAEEIAGFGQGVANQIGGMFGNMGNDLLTAYYLQQGMSPYESYKAAQKATPAEIQSAINQMTGGNKEMQQYAYMSRGLSPDVIDLMTTKDFSKMSDSELKLVSKGFSGQGAAAGSISASLENANQKLVDTFQTETAKQIIVAESQLKEQLMQTKLLGEIKTLLSNAKTVNEPLQQQKAVPPPQKEIPFNQSYSNPRTAGRSTNAGTRR